jgi:hypothetical protein
VRFGSHNCWPYDGGVFRGVHAFKWSETSKPAASRLWSLNWTADKGVTSSSPPDGHCKHPWREDVMYGRDGALRLWSAATGTHSELIGAGTISTAVHGMDFIDPVNDVAVWVGTPGSVAPFLIDLTANLATSACKINGNATTSWGGPNGATFNGSGCEYVWDDDNACIWALKANQGTGDADFHLWKIELTNKATCTFSVTLVTTSGAKPTFTDQAASQPTGVKWSREMGGIVISQGYLKPASFIKTSTKV